MRWTKFRDLNLKWYEYLWAALPIGLMTVGGAIGGACGGGAMAINVKLMQSQRSAGRKYGLTGLVSLGAIGAYYIIAKVFLSVTGLGGMMTAEQVDRELKSEPMFVALQKGEPQAYETIRGSMIDGATHGKSQAEIITTANGQLKPIIVKYLPMASDDALLDMARILTLELDQLKAKSPDACFAYATGSAPIDITQFVTPEILKMEKAATTAVLETGIASPQRIPSRDETAPTLKLVVQQLIAAYGAADVTALAKPASMDHARYCEMSSAIYKQALMLPRDQAVPFLRNIFGHSAA